VKRFLDFQSLNKRKMLVVFSFYSYVKQFEYITLNLLPPLLRTIWFRSVFSNLGRGTFIDYGFTYRYGSKIYIGKNVEINRDCRLFPSYHISDGEIIIGDDVIIAPGVQIYCAGQNTNPSTRLDVGGKIEIKSGAYVGANVFIRYGVTIGCGSTIGAGSVVVTDIPDNKVYAGNPAREILRG